MVELRKQIDILREHSGYWTERLHSQLEYLAELVRIDRSLSPEPLAAAVRDLLRRKKENGGLVKSDVLEIEARLTPGYAAAAKALRLHLISHAHIDIDWRWSWEETVGIVIDTFQTMLRLLEEYPDFIYSQSQAAVYEIVEKYAPELLPDIRRRVQEGRWEVLASTWVENDKNMSGTEAQARHILYTKRYLARLLDLDPDSLETDFEPDTFGHSRNLPELLRRGGVRYYYHCRGNDNEELYRWRAPSGAEVLTLRDPQWYYLKETDYHIARHVPGFCARNHTGAAVRFYGVGDHGGGPSRRDIERILDMRTWPLMPTMLPSRLHDFFHEAEAAWEQLPVADRELNYIYTGCYTAQSRLKQANRHGEDRLYDSEALGAMAAAAGCDLSGMPPLEPAWRKVLLNQFHDLLPGSCTRDAREGAMGRLQAACALALANSKRALKELGQLAATDAFHCEVDPDSLAEGGGTGYGSWKGCAQRAAFCVNGSGNAGGAVRAYTIFNTTAYDRVELVELTVWDWGELLETASVCGPDRTPLPFSVLEDDLTYWHHKYGVLCFMASVPAFGYRTYYVTPSGCAAPQDRYFEGPRVHRICDGPLILENELLKATFRRDTMELISLLDKATGQEQLGGPVGFQLVDEQSVLPYSAWTVGQAGAVTDLNQACFVSVKTERRLPLLESVTYMLAFRRSTLKVTVSLPANSPTLRFSVETTWYELGEAGGSTPQLRFRVPYGYTARTVRCDVPGGFVDRPELGHDVPAIRYVMPIPAQQRGGVMLTSDCKYGYRAFENTLYLNLLRGSINPDPCPEYGVCQMELGLGLAREADWYALTAQAMCFAHPLYIYSNTIHPGTLPASGQFLALEGRANVASVRRDEDGNIFFRLYQSDEDARQVTLRCPDLSAAERTDLLERTRSALPAADGAAVELAPKALESIRLRREKRPSHTLHPVQASEPAHIPPSKQA